MLKIATRIFAVAIASGANWSLAQAPGANQITQAADETVGTQGKDAFVRSLALRADRIIVDSSYPAIFRLVQTTSAAYAPSSQLKLKLSLVQGPTENNAVAKELGVFDIFPRDFMAHPNAVSADLIGTADGTYRLIAEVKEGDAGLTTLEQVVYLVEGIDAKRGDIERRLAKIEGHDSTKASIRFPFDYARVINIGKRSYTATDLGINQQGQPNYFDFSSELKRSLELLSALESGKDLLWQAKGDVKRHYWMAESGEILPYRVFVPPTWDGKTALPLVFIMHGNTRNESFYFQRDEQIIPKTAEKHGYMLVGVFGYHPSPASYNIQRLRGGPFPPRTPPDFIDRASSGPQPTRGGARGAREGQRGGGTLSMNGMPQSRIGAMSETDTMHVFDLIKKEYPIDPNRTFLFGYSAGGNGGYWIASNYSDNWSAIAIGGAGTGPNLVSQYFDRFAKLKTPFLIFHGEQDAGVASGSRSMVEAMKERGIDAELKILPGATHDTAPSTATPFLFDFFDAHPRK